MPFSYDDETLIKNLNQFREYGSQEILAEFLEKQDVNTESVQCICI